MLDCDEDGRDVAGVEEGDEESSMDSFRFRPIFILCKFEVKCSQCTFEIDDGVDAILEALYA